MTTALLELDLDSLHLQAFNRLTAQAAADSLAACCATRGAG